MNTIKTRLNSLLLSFICFRSYGFWSIKKAHNLIYEGHEKNKIFTKIVKDSFKDEFPEDVEGFSFITLTELKNACSYLGIEKGDTFLDLACGRGGPGLWIARETKADLIGMDLSDKAIESAKKRIKDFKLESNADFKTGNMLKTGFKNESFDGAVCIDSLWYAPDKTKALIEIHRVLKKNAKLVFTTWDGNIPFMDKDHKRYLSKAGFEVEIYKEPDGWKERQLNIYKQILKSSSDLQKEMGRKYADPIIKEAKTVIPVIESSKRAFVGAKKIQ